MTTDKTARGETFHWALSVLVAITPTVAIGYALWNDPRWIERDTGIFATATAITQASLGAVMIHFAVIFALGIGFQFWEQIRSGQLITRPGERTEIPEKRIGEIVSSTIPASWAVVAAGLAGRYL